MTRTVSIPVVWEMTTTVTVDLQEGETLNDAIDRVMTDTSLGWGEHGERIDDSFGIDVDRLPGSNSSVASEAEEREAYRYVKLQGHDK